MAFLCPSRLGRKQKKGLQSMFNKLPRNSKTDSITIEDLVKLSLKNPEARRIVLQSFTACADHELTVKQGQKVRYIYQEGDWAYIATNDKKEGFVPHIVLAKLGVPNKPTDRVIDTGTYTKKTFDIRKVSVESEGTDLSVSDNADDSFVSSEWSNDSMQEITSLGTDPGNVSKVPGTNSIKTSGSHHSNQEDITPPSPLAQYKVISDYKGHDEKEVSVRADDIVHLLDTSDPNWYWVRTLEGAEGYMPSYYVAEIPTNHNAKGHRNDSKNKNTQSVKGSNIDIEYEYDLNTVCNEDQYSVFSEDISDRATASDMQPQQKVRPKKPPRKNKPKSGSISQNLNDSVDSLDTVLTDSTMGAINDSVFDCSFSAESFLQDDTDATDDDIGYIGTPRGRVPSGLPYRDLIGFHLNSEIKHRRPSTHNKSLSKRNERRSHRAHSDKTNGLDAVLNKNLSNKALRNKQSSKYSEYSHQNDESFLSRTSDRRRNRPVSVPAFTTFQESRNGYFDEYFYEDSDTQFTNSDEHDVINVGEILKKRMAIETDKHERTDGKQRHDRTSGRRQHDTQLKAENQFHSEKPKIKPFLLNLPNTNIEKQHSKRNNTGNKEKVDVDTNRKLEGTQSSNSSVRVYLDDVSMNIRNKNKGEHNCNPLSVNKKQLSSADLMLTGKNTTDESVKTKSSGSTPNCKSSGNKSSKKHPVLKQYNSTTDLRAISDLSMENVEDKTKYTGSSINGMNAPEKHNDLFNNARHKHKGKRQYNSSSDLRSTDEPSKTETKPDQHKHSHHGTMGHSATRRYNSSTDLRHTKDSTDWSFGYPRKSRHTSGEDQQVTRVKNGSNASKRDTKILNLNGSRGSSASSQRQDYSDSEDDHFDHEKMMRLLSETDDLLNVSDDLLCGDSNCESVDETANECNAKVNKEANDKCNQFLTNSTIGINGMTSVPRNIETMNTNNESKNEVKVKSKSIEVQTDLNEDTCRNCSVCNNKKKKGQINTAFSSDVRGITEFVAQSNYEPEADNMLPMKMGEIVHVGLDGQESDKWYWAFSPRLRMYGFIPKEYVKIPMVTII